MIPEFKQLYFYIADVMSCHVMSCQMKSENFKYRHSKEQFHDILKQIRLIENINSQVFYVFNS